ncbi:DDE-type integrase/transposase/recombinase [Nocardia tengchongensis]
MSQRRACRLAGQSRSVQRRPPAVAELEQALRARLRVISGKHPRWGWRKAHALCRGEGLVTNHKRTQRLWREEGLKRPSRVRKKRRIGTGRNQRLKAAFPDQMWALDFQVDVTVDGRQVRFLNIVDEFTREALATRAFRSCTADQLVGVLEEIMAVTGRRPAHIRMGNGTEMTAYAMIDWPASISDGTSQVRILPRAHPDLHICTQARFNARYVSVPRDRRSQNWTSEHKAEQGPCQLRTFTCPQQRPALARRQTKHERRTEPAPSACRP